MLGENGAGKSTLMKLLSGFLQRDAGEIILDGKPVALDSPAAALQAGIGMIHQDPLDVPAFTALENFFCAHSPTTLPTIQSARTTLLELSERLGFAVKPDAPVASLTVGQRQQLEIMRLLACGVQVLILDEPTTGITAAQKVALFEALRRLAAEQKAVLFVSHKLDEVADLCNTVTVLQIGRVMGDGQMLMPQPQERLLELMFGQQSGAPRPPETPQLATTTDEPQSLPVWRLDGITAREDNLTLQNLSLSIPPGVTIGLSGLEGSGQSLLLRLLAGRLRPRAGQLFLNGANVTGTPSATFRQRGIAYLPADRLAEGMVGALSLSDHLALTASEGGLLVNRQAARQAAEVAIAEYNIKATPTTPIAALSGGNQQRAMLALLRDQCIGILMEQPTRGLDIVSARAIWQRLLARRSTGTALVFASADFEELLSYSDYILVFYSGQVSPLLPKATLTENRLAELIGGVGFEPSHA